MNDEQVQNKPFDNINRADPVLLLNFIQNEHPQVIALILAHLGPDKASVILHKLPNEMQGEVMKRIACMDYTSWEVVRGIEQVLEKNLSTFSGGSYSAVGGLESTAEILNLVDNTSKNPIIKAMENEEPELAEKIKARMVKKGWLGFIYKIKGRLITIKKPDTIRG